MVKSVQPVGGVIHTFSRCLLPPVCLALFKSWKHSGEGDRWIFPLRPRISCRDSEPGAAYGVNSAVGRGYWEGSLDGAAQKAS